MAYVRLIWVESETPLSAQNFNNIEDGIEELKAEKVDKVGGKGLSTNDYSNEEKGKVTNTYTWLADGANANLYAEGSAPGSSQYGSILRIRGDGKPGVAGVSDTYWIGVDSDGNIYTGTQLNGASTITWSGNAANTSF